MRISTVSILAIVGQMFCSATSSYSQVAVYVSPNDIQTAETSGIKGVTPSQIFTEDFESLSQDSLVTYHSPTIGVQYTSDGGAHVIGNNLYGGYNQGNYLGVYPDSEAVLNLDTPSQYFGLYFTAGDAHNTVEIYSGSKLLLQFTTGSLLSLLPNDHVSTLTAINGDNYLASDYYGQPTSGDNPSEPYAYLHFVTFGDDTFDKIVLRDTESAIFENDNHSILTVRPEIPDSLVLLTAVPEPTSLASIVLVGLVGFKRKRA